MDWVLTLPFLAGLIWAIGGREGGRMVRRIGAGCAVGLYGYLHTKDYLCLVCIFTYWIVTSLGYGKPIAKKNWVVLGLIGASYGLASFPIYAVTQSTLFFWQGLTSSIIFLVLVYFANRGHHELNWVLAEGFTGIGATILVPWMILT